MWLVLVTWFNMIGMAWFYVFIIRRCLGREGLTGPRDEAALDRFLARCGVDRDDLSSGQVAVLRSYCRTRRLTRWLLIPALAFSALAIYGATVALPRRAIETFAHFSPQRIVVVDLAKSTGKELAADPESLRSQVQIAMIGGMMICMLATLALFIPFVTVGRLLPSDERRTLMEFLKAGKTIYARHATISIQPTSRLGVHRPSCRRALARGSRVGPILPPRRDRVRGGAAGDRAAGKRLYDRGGRVLPPWSDPARRAQCAGGRGIGRWCLSACCSSGRAIFAGWPSRPSRASRSTKCFTAAAPSARPCRPGPASDGLLLETRRFRPCGFWNLESVRRAFDAAEPIGADYVDGVFHGVNPFTLRREPFLSRYTGWMDLKRPGTMD